MYAMDQNYFHSVTLGLLGSVLFGVGYAIWDNIEANKCKLKIQKECVDVQFDTAPEERHDCEHYRCGS